MKTLALVFSTALMIWSSAAMANDSIRIDQLEAKVKALTDRLDLLEKNLQGMKRGGFTVVPVVNCQLSSPYDGNYEANELSKGAATALILETCRAKAKNKATCDVSRVVCK